MVNCMPSLKSKLMKSLSALIGIMLCGATAYARDLTFDERVAAQRAIERVYYSHQIGTTKSFDETIPATLLENKVSAYLRKGTLLEHFWGTPLTSSMLSAEMNRILQSTQFPDRLREIFAALGNDSFMIQECFVRPVFVDRLVRDGRS